MPYIGDLLGVRGPLTTTAAAFTQRGYVANTLGYRRRKGTAAVLEQLARDLTGWPARAVEFFERLVDDAARQPLRAGGAGARSTCATPTRRQLVGTPFETARTPPTSATSTTGAAGTTSRTSGCSCGGCRAIRSTDVAARRVDASALRLRSARRPTAPLFNVPDTEPGLTQPAARRSTCPMPLTRRTLHRDLRRATTATPDDVHSLRSRIGPAVQTVESGHRVRPVGCGRRHGRTTRRPGKIAIDPQLGRHRVRRRAGPGGAGELRLRVRRRPRRWAVRPPRLAGRRAEGRHHLAGRASCESAARGRRGSRPTLTDAVKEWNQQPPGARGVIVLDGQQDVDRGPDTATTRIRFRPGSQLVVVAAQWPEEETGDPTAAGGAPDRARHADGGAAAPERGHGGCRHGTGRQPGPRAPGAERPAVEGSLTVMAGNLASSSVAHCTLPPAGGDLRLPRATPGRASPSTRSICGDLEPGARRPVSAPGRLHRRRRRGRADDVTIDSSTVLGDCRRRGRSRRAMPIFVGRVEVERRQVGCVRFSYLPLESEAPRRFRCQPTSEPRRPPSCSRSSPPRRSAIPATRCSPRACRLEIATGAEDEGEMGAWHFLQAPSAVRNLQPGARRVSALRPRGRRVLRPAGSVTNR